MKIVTHADTTRAAQISGAGLSIILHTRYAAATVRQQVPMLTLLSHWQLLSTRAFSSYPPHGHTFLTMRRRVRSMWLRAESVSLFRGFGVWASHRLHLTSIIVNRGGTNEGFLRSHWPNATSLRIVRRGVSDYAQTRLPLLPGDFGVRVSARAVRRWQLVAARELLRCCSLEEATGHRGSEASYWSANGVRRSRLEPVLHRLACMFTCHVQSPHVLFFSHRTGAQTDVRS